MSPEWTKRPKGRLHQTTRIMETFKTTRANYWVTASGYDCDGRNGGHVYSFSTEEEATIFAEYANEASDGLLYSVSSLEEMKKYCAYYGIDWEDCLVCVI